MDPAPKNPGAMVDPQTTGAMILPVCLDLKQISLLGRAYRFPRPERCPRCGSCRVWGHGYVAVYFDGFYQPLWLPRYRCADCRCVMRLRPRGYFERIQAPIDTVRAALVQRWRQLRWPRRLSASRCRHWLAALKQNTLALLGAEALCDLPAAFDRLLAGGRIPVRRLI